MKIISLRLINFRIFRNRSFSFKDGINNFYGRNGSGKTSLLEAISYLSLPRSFRGSKDEHLVRFGENFFRIEGTILSETQHRISILYTKQGKKSITIDGKRIKSYSQLFKTFVVLAFSFKDYTLIEGTPKERRRFFDWILSIMDSKYFNYLSIYKDTLKQRNLALRRRMDTSPWDRSIREACEYILSRRKEVVEYINSRLGYGIKLIHQTTGCTYDRYREMEYSRGYTIAGPHRDDFIFVKEGVPLKYFASEGERRIVYLELVSILKEMIESRTGIEPVLVFDEPGNVLDDGNFKRFLKNLKGQVIMSNLFPVEGAYNLPLEGEYDGHDNSRNSEKYG